MGDGLSCVFFGFFHGFLGFLRFPCFFGVSCYFLVVLGTGAIILAPQYCLENPFFVVFLKFFQIFCHFLLIFGEFFNTFF